MRPILRLWRAWSVSTQESRSHSASTSSIDDLEQRVADRTRELRDAQETLVRRERLAVLGLLSGGLGHELRKPLSVMTNAVYYLKAVLTTAPVNVHEYLDILQQQLALSERIVGDLLDFARQNPPQRTPTRIRQATQAQLDRLGSRAGLHIETHLPEDLPPVIVDPIQLGQIVFNLLTNAAEALDGTGRIILRARRSGASVALDVSDTGPGVPRENLEIIFEPLFSTKVRGIGLGLPVSRSLARANGGDLTVESTPGEGATFRLTLPVVS